MRTFRTFFLPLPLPAAPELSVDISKAILIRGVNLNEQFAKAIPTEIAKTTRDAVVRLELSSPVSNNLNSDTITKVKNKFQ